MRTNALPEYDQSDNPTGCCPRFKPAPWDGQELHFENKLFVRATTKADNYIPLDIDTVFQNTFNAIEKAGAYDPSNTLVLSRDLSPSAAEHLFAVTKDVQGQEEVELSGDYVTKVFEGPYKNAPEWEAEMQSQIEENGFTPGSIYFFYTTCPNCAEFYGENYTVAVAEVREKT